MAFLVNLLMDDYGIGVVNSRFTARRCISIVNLLMGVFCSGEMNDRFTVKSAVYGSKHGWVNVQSR